MLKFQNIRMPIGFSADDLLKATSKSLNIPADHLKNFRLVKKSLDARRKNDIHYVCSVSFEFQNEDSLLCIDGITKAHPFNYHIPKVSHNISPVIIGSGPAGLMAGLVLARAGLKPVIIERGRPADERKKSVEGFWHGNPLDPESNVQFGEGGAGTFSDGKLITGIKDPRCRFVIEEFFKAGAPEEILYLSSPHIGTDNLIKMVQNIRREIISLGGECRFSHKLVGITSKNSTLQALRIVSRGKEYELPAEFAILAIGHSARDTFDMLYDSGLQMLQKPFSAGVRIEHLQEKIDIAQYGENLGLPPASYKLSTHLKSGRDVYTFCMCPGGVVVAAASEPNCVVTNGMSFFSRNEVNANSALLVNVMPSDFPSSHPLAGVAFQRELEKRAFTAGGGNYCAPAQTVGDFLANRVTVNFDKVSPSYLPGVLGADLKKILPNFISASIEEALPIFDKRLHGFASYDAVMTGVETRSSSPVRIIRNESFQSNIYGLIPCGEGCGYAGGIMSAAVDGIKCAEAIISTLCLK